MKVTYVDYDYVANKIFNEVRRNDKYLSAYEIDELLIKSFLTHGIRICIEDNAFVNPVCLCTDKADYFIQAYIGHAEECLISCELMYQLLRTIALNLDVTLV